MLRLTDVRLPYNYLDDVRVRAVYIGALVTFQVRGEANSLLHTADTMHPFISAKSAVTQTSLLQEQS
jgi:hypothetical protein